MKSLTHVLISLLILTIGFGQEKTKKGKAMEQKPASNPVVVMETTMGTIEIEMFVKETPKTVENFIGLARKGYYNGIIFHRVIDNFMIQGGDPTGTGRGGESIWGKKFEDEFNPKLKHDGAGILSMANAGPNTNGSQFFITLVPTPHLDGKHTVFGKVISGLDVVKAIGKVKTIKPSDKPEKDVVMKKVFVKGEEPKETEKKK
ncbi:MAG: peptidylprolyl isomerase [Bacteroidota bacterium]|nr:peptidylprolyl isomerase [Bacteroidota bacterium]